MTQDIVSWAISVTYADGRTELLADMPDDVASAVDEWLSEVEANE